MARSIWESSDNDGLMGSSKELKELFVSGHSGTSAWEILLVCACVPVGILWFRAVVLSKRGEDERKLAWKQIVMEFVFLVFPMIVCQTELLYPWGLWLLIGQLITSVTSLVLKDEAGNDGDDRADVAENGRLKFVSYYRASVSYLTYIAILAVDFPLFPRRFAKTEIEGYGLMDLGAGSYLVASGLVFPCNKNHRSSRKKSAMQIVILLLLGFIRLITNKGIEYQEHVSEYGVHWNFFWTLAFVQSSSTSYSHQHYLSSRSVWMACLLLFTIYQCALSLTNDLQHFILHAPRHSTANNHNIILSAFINFIAANREGIFGIVGYTSLYWTSSEWIGRYALFFDSTTAQQRDTQKKRRRRLFTLTILFWGLHLFFTAGLGIPTSRRTTNVSFLTWTLAHNVTILTSLQLVSSASLSMRFHLLEAVNANGLYIFLIANLLTGIVNLTFDTLHMKSIKALIILTTYVATISAIALLPLTWSSTKKHKHDSSSVSKQRLQKNE